MVSEIDDNAPSAVPAGTDVLEPAGALTYEIGHERTPWGLEVLTLSSTGSYAYEVRVAGRVMRASRGAVDHARAAAIFEALARSSFPEVPAHGWPPGALPSKLWVRADRVAVFHDEVGRRLDGYADALPLLDEIVADAREAARGGELPAAPPRAGTTADDMRLVYEEGHEHAPDDPWGLERLSLDRDGAFVYERRQRGLQVAIHAGHVELERAARVFAGLARSGFPQAPAHAFIPGPSTATIALGADRVTLARRFGVTLEGYREVLETLAELIADARVVSRSGPPA